MKELSLPEIKQIEFEILNVLDAFCKENNIQYFLSNGTLLGAVKYKGFIPWDDDVDVLVPREDYNKMLTLFHDGDRYRFYAFEKESEYRFPFAKLVDLTTRKEENYIHNGVELGLDIDIFPLDQWDASLKKARREAKRINKKMFCLGLTKLYKPDSKNATKRAIKGVLMFFCKLLGSKRFVRAIIKASKGSKQKGSPYVGCKAWCIYGEREIIPAEAFSGTVQVEFEGRQFPAPIGYETYLRSLYGDYTKDPPLEKQKSHHSYHAYRL